MPKFEIVAHKTDWMNAFIEAESLEEAKEFARKNLKVIEFDPDIEGLVELSDVIPVED